VGEDTELEQRAQATPSEARQPLERVRIRAGSRRDPLDSVKLALGSCSLIGRGRIFRNGNSLSLS
jgi:hypothetical protein